VSGATRLFLGGVAALMACAVGAVLDYGAFLQGWLVSAVFWLSAPLGALGLIMVHRVTGGAWGEQARPALDAAAATLPLSAAAFVPLAACLGSVYPWVHPAPDLAPVIAQKASYLNPNAFLLRSLAYFAIWLILARLMGVWRPEAPRSAKASAIGALLWLATIVLFALDWVMSLSPQWTAQSFPVAVAVGMFMTALTVITLGAGLCAEASERCSGVLDDLARMLFAAILFWIYLMYVQYLIVWTGNQPRQIAWYLGRGQPLWQLSAALLFSVFGLIAGLGLFWRRAREDRRALMGSAWVLLVAEMLAAVWVFLPNFDLGHVTLGWVTPAALIGIGGVWSALYLALLRRKAQEPWREGASHG
jgi:hypothetical protein